MTKPPRVCLGRYLLCSIGRRRLSQYGQILGGHLYRQGEKRYERLQRPSECSSSIEQVVSSGQSVAKGQIGPSA